jgi:1,2-diacylglycerol 3-beta-glucosyltransferase
VAEPERPATERALVTGADAVLTAAGVAAGAVLVPFALRRAVFLVAALLPPRRTERGSEPPSVALVVAVRNEEGSVPQLLESLATLDYPAARLSVVLVDDASEDATHACLAAWAAGRPRTVVVSRARSHGKAAALNAGLEAAPAAELVGVCDADQRVRPDWLRRACGAFADQDVGAVQARLEPANAGRTPVARYAALEAWVHQLVTAAAKDRLALDPPLLGGGAVYRVAALAAIGGFPPTQTAEDASTTAALSRSGWRIRFVPDAVVDNWVVERWRDYWDQHVRWSRNLFDARQSPRSPSRMSPTRAVESWFVSAGYADRLALLAAIGLAAAGRMPVWVPAGYLVLVAGTVAVAIVKAGAARRLPGMLATAVVLLPLDIAASGAALLAHVAGRPRSWRSARAAGS